MELALLEAQIVNERAKGLENRVDVGLKQAKTLTERSKAKNLESQADMTNLDYLERESGLKHQRELESKLFDRNTQLDLKGADFLLNNQEGRNRSNSNLKGETDLETP